MDNQGQFVERITEMLHDSLSRTRFVSWLLSGTKHSRADELLYMRMTCSQEVQRLQLVIVNVGGMLKVTTRTLVYRAYIVRLLLFELHRLRGYGSPPYGVAEGDRSFEPNQE